MPSDINRGKARRQNDTQGNYTADFSIYEDNII